MEIWKSIDEFDGWYEVSDLGRVRSWIAPRNQSRPRARRVEPLFLKPALQGADKNKRYKVSLSSPSGEIVQRAVHKLVAEAFLGPCPEGEEVAHGPGGTKDNRLINLSYKTKDENNGPDKWRDGSLTLGEEMWMATLTEEEVREARRRYGDRSLSRKERKERGLPSYSELAERMGKNRITIYNAVVGRTWYWLDNLAPRWDNS